MRAARLWIARSLWVIATAALVLWAIGTLASDRWMLTQRLSWAPSEIMLAGSGLLLVVAWIVVLGLKPRRVRRQGWRRLRSFHALPLALVAIAGFSVAREFGVFRLSGAVDEGDLRIVFWNASNTPLPYPPTLVSEHRPDLAIIANPRWGMGREMLYTMVHEPTRNGERGTVLWRHGFAIASRFGVLRSGSTSLGLNGVRDGMDLDRDGVAAFDAGSAVFLELDTRETIGRATVVWILDLPSDPSLHRAAVVRKAVEAMRVWRGPDGARGFPEADIVVGDLNIPAGSWSLSGLAPGTVDAHRQRGRGAGRTWPRERPWWRIDHVRVRPPWVALGSRVVDPGAGRHRMIVVDLSRPR